MEDTINSENTENAARSSFFARWRENLKRAAPVIKAEAARAGMVGVAVASVGMMVSDPTLYPQVMTGLFGSFIADKLLRWRKVETNSEEQRAMIEADLQTNQANPDVQALFQELNLVEVVTEALGGKLVEIKNLLQQLLDAGFAVPEQVAGVKIMNYGVMRDTIGTQIIQQSQRYTYDSLHQLRPIPYEFTGYTEKIDEILKAVRAASERGVRLTTATTINISGTSGTGKTELANFIGHALMEDYPDAQLFIEMRAYGTAPRTVAQAQASVLQQFYPSDRLPEDEANLRALYLNTLHDKRAVVLIDDCASDKDAHMLLPPRGCVALITSRPNLAIGHRCRLEGLSRPESISLLRHYRHTLTEAQADAIADLRADLPIALSLDGRLLDAYESLSVDSLINSLESDPIGKHEYEGQSVRRGFATHYESLPTELRRIWCALSVIPADFDCTAAAAVGEFDAEDLPSPLDELVRFNLIRFDGATIRYRWHDLLKAFAASRADTLERPTKRYIEYFVEISRRIDDLFTERKEQMDAARLFDIERANLENTFMLLAHDAASEDELNSLIILVKSLTGVGDIRFNVSQSQQWLYKIHEAAEKLDDRWHLAFAKSCLGRELGIQEKELGMKFLEEALTIFETFNDGKQIGYVLSHMGFIYRERGDLDVANDMYLRRLQLAREVNDLSGVCDGIYQLALTSYVSKNYQEAKRGFKEALDVATTQKDLMRMANASSLLARVSVDLDETESALKHYQSALKLYDRLRDPRNSLICLNAMAKLQQKTGLFSDAEGSWNLALQIARNLGDKESDLQILAKLAANSELTGNIVLALKYLDKCVLIAHEIGYPDTEMLEKRRDELRMKL
jgi:tetratricopeptide (TPR) repeat protein